MSQVELVRDSVSGLYLKEVPPPNSCQVMNLNVYSVGAASVTATVQPTTDADKLNSGDDF